MNFTPYTNISFNQTGWTPNTTMSFDKRSPLAVLVQAVSLAIIMFSSIFGNVLILLAIYTNRHLREITSVFIANLACADLLLAVIGMPFTLTSSVTYDWIFGKHLCRIHGMSNGIFCFASMLSLAAVSVERYVAITKPLKYRLIMTQRTVTIMIIYVWAQSIFCAILPFFGWSRYTYVRNESMCTGDWPYNVPYVLFLFALNFFFPLIIMTYCYYHIFKTAKDHSKRIRTAFTTVGGLSEIELRQRHTPVHKELQNNDQEKDVDQKKHIDQEKDMAQGKTMAQEKAEQEKTKKQKVEKKYKQDKKAAKTLLLVMGTFLFCWTPHVVGMTCLLFPSCAWPDEFFATTTWLAMLNSGCNPVIYGFLNRRFRQSFKHIISCGKLRTRQIQNLVC